MLQMSDDPQLEARVEPGRTPSAAPTTSFAPGDLQSAARTCIDIAIWSSRCRKQRASDLRERDSHKLGNAACDTVMAMVSVPTTITVSPVPHVDQLFGNDDLERLRLFHVNSCNVNQYRVMLMPCQKHVRSADGGVDASTQP